MSTEAQLYETPARGLNEKEINETGATKKMAESKYEYGTVNGSSRMDTQTDQNLTDIESKIKQIGEELRDIHDKMALETDKYSENYLTL